MSKVYVHTIGDSTLDNLYWMLDSEGSNAHEARQDSVEGQLYQELNLEEDSTYEVISHAYDGFTTSSVLGSGNVGKVLRIQPNSFLSGRQKAYLAYKNIKATSDQYDTSPLGTLKDWVKDDPEAVHYVVISVGGNDFRERLKNPVAMLMEIPHIHERYLRILKEVKSLKGKDIRPILVFQYRLDAHNDYYGIYAILKVVGVFFAFVQSIALFGISASAAFLLAKKAPLYLGLSLATFALSHQVIPFKAITGVFRGQQLDMATLGGLIETFYRPILAQAKVEGIPILDLPNTFCPYDSDLYISQIEPSKRGGRLIAEGIAHIIKHHDFSSAKNMLYSQRDTRGFIGAENRNWTVHYS